MLADMDRSVRNKGYKLYSEGACTLLDFDDINQYYDFAVDGQIESFYQVSINLLESFEAMWTDEDDYSCECIYFEENLECKHIAAALFYLSAFPKDLRPNPAPPARSLSAESKEPVVLLCNPQDPQDVLAKINFKKENLQFFPDALSAQLENEQIEYLIQHHYHQYKLRVRAGKDRLTFDSDRRNKPPMDNLLHWYHQRIERHPEEIVYLTKEGRNQALQQVLAQHQIPLNKAKVNEVFKIVFAKNRFQIVPIGELEGLYLPEALDGLKDALIRSNRSWTEGRYLEGEAHPERGKYNAGILVHWTPYGRKTIGFYPIMAKGSKGDPEALKVKLDWLRSPREPLLRKKDKLPEIFVLLNNINQLLEKSKSETEELELYGYLEEFFEATKEYPFFLTKAYLGNRDKPRMMDIRPLTTKRGCLSFQVGKETLSYTLQPLIGMEEQALPVKNIKEKADLLDHFVILEEKQLIFFRSPKDLDALRSFWELPLIRYTEAYRPEVERKLLQELAVDYPIQFEKNMLKKEELSSKPLRQVYISELSQFVMFRPLLDYGERVQINPLLQGAVVDFDANKQLIRDEEEEQDFVRELRSLHPDFAHKGSQGFFYLSFEDFVKDLWFLKTFEKLKAREIEVYGLNELKNLRFSPYPAKVAFKLDSKQDWFEAHIEVAFGNNKVKLKDIKKAVESGGTYIELSDGSLGILPEKWLQKFAKLFRSGQQEKEALRIAKTHFKLIDEVAEEQDHQKILSEIAVQKEKLASFTTIAHTRPPAKLQAQLRHYQQQGLNWLNFLREFGWGGILADDMGLGKTLQMIALICQIMEEETRRPVLVVAPTTLLFNWKKELEKFAPHLDYFIHHGQRYEDPKELEKHDLILTSYGVVINDIELLREVNFELIVADESQAIKNTQSLRHKAMIRLKGKLKIALSGTPIENHIGELFAQMNFVNPGFFVSQAAFKRDYVNKFRKEYNEELVLELKHKVAPFILRRTKEEVLPELPDKTEEYLYCEMPAVQRKIYDAHRNEYRDFLLKKFDEDGAENSKMYVLEGLTRLRQICDSTALVSHGEGRQESVKIDLLINHITEKTGHHKILVFSQFVKMLELVEKELRKEDIPYSYLDGQTSLKEREARVSRFQEDEEVRVFLVSLKAGGTGLNLTAADYVYILDPWWNPATENQAIDRCYRMGQKKNVFAYRMICKDTVEEKIIKLQESKKKVSRDLIGEGDSILASLDKERLLALFE